MARKRVHEIAKAQGVTSKELLAALASAGIEAKAAASSVEEADALVAISAAKGDGGAAKASEGAATKPAEAKPAASAAPAKAAPARRPARTTPREWDFACCGMAIFRSMERTGRDMVTAASWRAWGRAVRPYGIVLLFRQQYALQCH